MKTPTRMRAVLIAVLCALIAAAIIIPNALSSRLCDHGHGCAVIAGLRAYLGAQGTFQRADRYGKGDLVYANTRDGSGFVDLYRIGGVIDEPDGTEIKLTDLAFARASSAETPKCGYWFVDIVGDKRTGRHYDYTKECGLCAVPAVYEDRSLSTFIVNMAGTVYKKDNGGKPVTVFPDVAEDGWTPVGM